MNILSLEQKGWPGFGRKRLDPGGTPTGAMDGTDPKPVRLLRLGRETLGLPCKVVSHGRYVAFQVTEVAVPRTLFAAILRLIAELRPRSPPIPA